MRKWRQFRPSPASVISVVAVFFAIGGIGYAAATIGTNDIKNGAVTKKKLHKNAVDSTKVKNHSLKKADLAFNPSNAFVGELTTIATAQATPTVGNGGIKVIASSDGFRWELVCQAAPVTSALLVHNQSGGDNSHIAGGLSAPDDDFDQGEDYTVIFNNGTNAISTPQDQVEIYGTAGGGSTQAGFGDVINQPNFAGSPDCAGSLNLLAP
jgi:hypothetical protein